MAAIAFWGLIVIVALAPFPLGSNRPGPWSALAIGVGLVLIGWAAAVLRDSRRVALPWALHWPATAGFAAVLAWLYLQTVPWTPAAWHNPLWSEAASALGEPLRGAVSLSPSDGVTAMMRLITYGAVFWLAMNLGISRRRAAIALWSVVSAGTVYAAYGIAVEFAGNQTILWYQKWAYFDSMTSTFVNRNNFASYTGMALLIAVALLSQKLRDSRQEGEESLAETLDRTVRIGGFLFVIILLLGSAILLSHSRGGLFALIPGIAVLAYGSTRRADGARTSRHVVFGIILVLVSLIVIGGGATLDRLEIADGPVSIDGRSLIFDAALKGIRQAPLTGYGYGTFESVFDLWRSNFVSFGRIDKAHNTYLEFAVEAGIPAFLCMLAILGWIALKCFVGMMSRRRDAIYPMVAMAVTAQQGIHALVDFNLQIPAVAAAYCLVLGVGFAQCWRTSEVDPLRPG